MQGKKQARVIEAIVAERPDDQLRSLLEKRPLSGRGSDTQFQGVVIGELVAMVDGGATPLVAVPGHTAVRARTTVDVHGAHVGGQLALMFENADPAFPVIMGIVRAQATSGLQSAPGSVDVEADGERLVVAAKQQLVLRCGKAKITLTRAGKVLVEGTYISSRSSGVNRLKGGSVHLN